MFLSPEGWTNINTPGCSARIRPWVLEMLNHACASSILAGFGSEQATKGRWLLSHPGATRSYCERLHRHGDDLIEHALCAAAAGASDWERAALYSLYCPPVAIQPSGDDCIGNGFLNGQYRVQAMRGPSGLARRHVREFLEGRAAPERVDDAVLVTSELVGNALRHTADGPDCMCVEVYRDVAVLRVHDAGRDVSRVRARSAESRWMS
ncbi:ATP-binding protein [Streptomyces fructofermentans]|uniref:Regulatory protein n=1 Tax=Streptomyces fructofermentans TaxID=152141 RepID=A0A918NHA6_9ACTN|nr:hypothetical protein [Streptomyces fructofermentans]GGX70408.1 hypothetical protein GCM10010515_42650 [Streptomyces fructofermentans]